MNGRHAKSGPDAACFQTTACLEGRPSWTKAPIYALYVADIWMGSVGKKPVYQALPPMGFSVGPEPQPSNGPI